MSDFEVSFDKVHLDLARLTQSAVSLGAQLDKLEAGFSKNVSGISQLAKALDASYGRLEKNVKGTGDEVEALTRSLQAANNIIKSSMMGMATSALQAETRYKALRGELGDLGTTLANTQAFNMAADAMLKVRNITTELAAKSEVLKARREALATTEGKVAANRQAQVAGYTRLTTAETRQLMMSKELTQALELQNTARGASISVQQAQVAALRSEQQETTKQTAELARLERQYKSLHGGLAESIVRQKELNNQRKQAILDDVRGTKQARDAAAAEKLRTQTLTAAAKAQASLNKTQKDAEQRLRQLRAEAEQLNSAYGRNLAIVQRQIKEQTAYNRMLAMTRRELLGLVPAQDRVNRSLNVSNQTGAMLRATMGGLRANIGMYTSSTILAATATYAFARAIRSSLEVGSEFSATMARVEAIMGSGAMGGFAGSGMQQIEDQIRSLGQTTIFTAAEVSEGMIELGMAGLSATESMVALQPALDLAMIGNISMAESADIATNIMMTFGMQAEQLTEVVDVMAMAITNSNTTIAQLANAISYVGPAAESAGISLEDTAAAIEVLANSGIKGSRAGTGLRRLFVNMLNPTKKGADAMRKYGISILDFEGNTRSLQSILGQLHRSLYDDAITPAERLAAVVDMVGVRAASAVSTLIGAGGEGGTFEVLRHQLENAEGAAKRMRDIIQNSLVADYRRVLSAFQEVQLTAMESQEARLKYVSAYLSNQLIELTKPITDESSITHLDLLLARIERIVKMVGIMGAGYLSFKVLSGSVAFALAGDLSRVATVMGVLSKPANAAAVNISRVGAAAFQLSDLSKKAAVSQGVLAAGLSTTTGVAGKTAAALSTVATWAGVASRSLGWLGLLGGIGYGLYSFLKEDDLQVATAQAAANDELSQSYKRLTNAMEKTAVAKANKALRERYDDIVRGIKQANEDLVRLIEEAATAKSLDLDTTDADRRVAATRMALASMEKELSSIASRLTDAPSTTADLNIARERGAEILREILKWEKEITDTKALQALGYEGLETALEGQKTLVAALKTEWDEVQDTIEKTLERLLTVSATIDDLRKKRADSLRDAAFEDTASVQEKIAAEQQELNKLLQQENEFREKARTLELRQAAGVKVTEKEAQDELVDSDTLNDLSERILESQMKLAKYRREAAEAARKYALEEKSLYEDIADYHRTDEERLEFLKERLTLLDQELEQKKSILSDEDPMAVDPMRDKLEIDKERFDVLKQIDSIQASIDKSGAKGVKSLADQIKEASSTFSALRKEFDPVGSSLSELIGKQKQLALLLEHTDLTQDQYRRGLFELQKAHVEVELAQEKNLEALYALQQEYSKSPFESTIEDMLELQRLYDEGAVSMDRYIQLSQQMKAKANADAISGAPTTSFQMQGAASTPFNELGSTMIGIAEGNAWYDTRGQELVQGQNMSGQLAIDTFDKEVMELRTRHERMMELNRENHEAQLALTEEYNAKVQAAEDRKNAAIRESQDQLNRQSAALTDDRKRYEEESSKLMMISMLGTAESILGMFAAVGEDATTAQKVAFAAQKSLAVAQILLYTHVAASKANAELPVFAGLTMAELILAQGYASAGLVTALSIGQLSGGGSSSSYAGAYDKGGWIPAGKWGVVGEYGPEMVHGPANVTGREKTSKMLGGGGDEFNITLAPVINVESSGSGSNQNAEEEGKILGNTLKLVVLSTMQEQMRPNGMLDTWVRNARRG